jgi:predicted RNase H-like nuclease
VAVVAGLDGCRAGWVWVSRDLVSGEAAAGIVSRIDEVDCLCPQPEVLAVDVPIGLTDSGPRTCDREARALLGWPRRCSVFPAPIRAVLDAESYAEACRIGRERSGRALSVQTWGILPKIREVDRYLRSDVSRTRRVREVHPEVSFRLWNGGRAMVYRKKSAAGRAEREALVLAAFGPAYLEARGVLPAGGCAPDDLLDAFAALWTAERIRRGAALTLPSSPPLDAFGLRMEIVA